MGNRRKKKTREINKEKKSQEVKKYNTGNRLNNMKNRK